MIRTQRAGLLSAVFVSYAAAYAVGCGPVSNEPKAPERVVLIVVDTLRADALSSHGSATATPAIDSLAARGVSYRNAVSSFHGTTMSMAALFTGRTPSIESGDPSLTLPVTGRTWCGMARFARAPDEKHCIPQSLTSLAEAMKSAGYWTIGISSNPLLFPPFGIERGFEDWAQRGIFVPLGSRLTPEQVRQAQHSRSARFVLPAVQEALARRRSDRFFLYVHIMEAHDHDGTQQGYAKGVAAADRAVARVLAMLEHEDLSEDTLFVLTADHGERLGEKHILPGRPLHEGNPAFDELLRVPLIVAPAGTDDPLLPLRNEDVYRLILDRAGAESGPPSSLADDELLLTELAWLTYRRGPWKSFYRRSDGAFFLIDLAADAGETRDVRAEHPEIATAHRKRIETLAQELGAHGSSPAQLSDDDRARLKTLGYLDED